MDRAQLEAMALEKISKMQTAPSSAPDRAALERAAMEKLSSMGQTPVREDAEASLGVVNRARYSIEPLQSNRKALLIEEYGPDNVMENQKGDLYVNQNGQFLPVNKDGVSLADGTDFLGATPEMVGGLAGTAVGALAGVPTGGTASIPLAMGMGATGAAAGSGARQLLSAAIGTPQVASVGERALETGLSAAIGGVTSGAVQAVKPYAKQAHKGITGFIKNIGKEAADTATDTASTTVAKTQMQLGGKLSAVDDTAEDIAEQIEPNGDRAIVQERMKELSDIAKKEGLPAPTIAQAAQGKAILAENKLLDIPLVRGKVRKQVDKQAKLIKDNLESITGRKINFDNDIDKVGQSVRENAETIVAARKQMAQELYEKVEEEGGSAMLSKYNFLHRFKNNGVEAGVVTTDGAPTVYNGARGMSEDTFNKLQKIYLQGMNASGENPTKMSFGDANGIVKTLKANAKELKATNADAHRRIQGLVTELNATLEGVLNREAPRLGEKFRAANSNYRAYKVQREALEKLIAGKGDEKIVGSIMNTTAKIEPLKEIIGEERVKEIGKSYVADIIYKLDKSGIARADTARDAIRKSKAQIVATIGEGDYTRLMNNLEYLNSTGRPLTLTRETMYNLLDNRGAGFKGYVLQLAGAANTVAESRGTNLTKAVKDTIVETTLGAGKAAGSTVDKVSGGNKTSGLANILGDSWQRGSSYSPAPLKQLTAEEEEIQRRKRAISGGKGMK